LFSHNDMVEVFAFKFSEGELEAFLKRGCGKNLGSKKPPKICSTTCPLQGAISTYVERNSLRINPELSSVMEKRISDCEVRGESYTLRISKELLTKHVKRICKTNLINKKEKAKICGPCLIRNSVFEILLEEFPDKSDNIRSRMQEYSQVS